MKGVKDYAPLPLKVLTSISGRLYKGLMEAVGNRVYINFAVLGLPQSGKTEFICTIRGEENSLAMTRSEGEKVSKKKISIAGKTLIYEEGRDINGLRLDEYEDLCQRADVIYFFFKAHFFLQNKRLSEINEQSEDEHYNDDVLKNAIDYQSLVGQYLGSVVNDRSAQKKPINIIASFKDQLPDANSKKKEIRILNEIATILKKQGLLTENCKLFLTDLHHDKSWIELNALELINKQKNRK